MKNEIDNLLDKIIVKISEELLDDLPAGDPRWMTEEKSSSGLGSSSAMQIQHQLLDKQKAHELLLQFLQACGLLNRLAAKRCGDIGGVLVATTHLLADHSELIVAAITLRDLLTVHSSLLSEIIDEVREEECERGLTKQDYFFKDITMVHKCISALANKCERESRSDINPIHLIDLITETNNIITVRLKNLSFTNIVRIVKLLCLFGS